MGKMHISDEERKRRSERMLQLHAEKKAGPEYGKLGGRPKKRRVSEVINEKAEEKAEEIWNKLWDAVNQDESTKISLEAIKMIVDIGDKERKFKIEEEVRYEQLKHTELAELVIGNLFELVRAGKIDLAEIEIDGSDVVEEGAIGEIGEGDGSAED